jgi:hypothetical protein
MTRVRIPAVAIILDNWSPLFGAPNNRVANFVLQNLGHAKAATFAQSQFFLRKIGTPGASLLIASSIFLENHVQRVPIQANSWKKWQNGTYLFILSSIISRQR